MNLLSRTKGPDYSSLIKKLKQCSIALFGGILCLSPVMLYASWQPSSIVMFGDEKSDNGATYAEYKFPISPPYWYGRFSNGPSWIEYLANRFNLIPDPTRNPNYNKGHLFLDFSKAFTVVDPKNIVGMFYPFGSPQKNGISNFKVITLKQQVDQYLRVNRAYRPTAMVVMWLGMHDLESKTCLKNAIACMNTVVTMTQNQIIRLYKQNIRHFLVLTVPDVSNRPAVKEYFTAEQIKTFKSIIGTYNSQYYAMEKYLQQHYPGIKVLIFNFYEFKNPLYHSIKDAANKICYKGTYYKNSTGILPCENPLDYYWWDEYDPTTQAFKDTANGVYQAIANDPSWDLRVHWWQRMF